MKNMLLNSIATATKFDRRYVKFAIAVGILALFAVAAGAPAPFTCGACY